MIGRAVATALLLVAGQARAADTDAPASPPNPASLVGTITTHGTARDRLPNTVADVQLSVDSRGRTLAEAQNGLSSASPKLMGFLRGAGVDRLGTDAVSVQPELDTSVANRPPRITGYTGHVTVTFQVPAGKLGALLGDTLANGASTVDRVALHPSQSELDGARDRLAAAATRSALTQARAVAEAAGRQPGPLRSVTVEGGGGGAQPNAFPVPPPRMLALAASAPISTEAGDSEVSVDVTLVITLAPP